MKLESTLITLLALFSLTGCGAGGNSSKNPSVEYGQSQTPVEATLDSSLTTINAFPNLSFEQPLYFTSVPSSDNYVVVVEQKGTIKIFENDSKVTTSKDFLNIKALVSTSSNEEGLLGLTFDPDYINNGYLYVYYSVLDGARRSRVARYQLAKDSENEFIDDEVNEDSESIILEVAQPFGNHNGGMIEFGPDGYLYVSLGDGGSGNDPIRHGQNRTTLLGTLLRIEPITNGYNIPPDNPFLGVGIETTGEGIGDNVREEIWAYGFRNPWRFSFDRQQGTIWLGDVGQGEYEEIDIVIKGGNYGWSLREGNHDFNDDDIILESPLIDPVLEYGRDVAQSITGGYVYRGNKIQALTGLYIFGDYITGNIWAYDYEGASATASIVATVPEITSFGEDQEGEIYIVSRNGSIFKFE
ncbi:PQQ-dependent sugar dehydrogenase [Thalassotalea psychrophila]|uniref:PQQ-dependent sugar dehydrogenase n=1 Tax=Thalassotalea psychrophila TaxID=3065647 RepID=A0ABY9TYV2_9GAMM|nr:PQQ-dependent sugar dehydrogenase [Colwelliaceae bacterium SQ149]